MNKSFLKIWNGECSYQAIECFGSIDAAAKKVVPSTAAKIVVDEKSIRYQHSTIKEVVNNDDTLPTPGRKDPGEGKGEKKVERKDNKTAKK
jgi:hypothetical protein